MLTRQYGSSEQDHPYVSRVIVETLKRTRGGASIDISEVADAARATSEMTRRALERFVDLDDHPRIKLETPVRLKLALEAIRLGEVQSVARGLTWQEFEEFSEDCLRAAEFDTKKGLLFGDETRRWQVDIVALKKSILLVLDCKHWESTNYSSKFHRAVEHQKQVLQPLIRHMRANGSLIDQKIWALPLIVTLFEPRVSLLDAVVIVSIGQLPDFLGHLTPYDSELPFTSDHGPAESPIS